MTPVTITDPSHCCRPRPAALWLILTALLLAGAASAQAQTRMQMSMSVTTTMQVYTADMVDVQPAFPGGDRALLSYINTHRQYPASAMEARVQGRVLCGFVVMPDGTLCNANVVRGVEDSLDAEAMRLVGGMPRWEAGTVAGREVPVYMVIPIIFRLR